MKQENLDAGNLKLKWPEPDLKMHDLPFLSYIYCVFYYSTTSHGATA